MVADDDALTATRLDVAEMKGMLKQALSDHGQRIRNLEEDNRLLHGRVSDKSKVLAGHAERISDLENTNNARRAFVFSMIAAIVAVAGLALAILNRITI